MSEASSFERIEELFHAASALAPTERPAFLEEACGGDEALRSEVESLLAADCGDTAAVRGRFAAGIAGQSTLLEPGETIGPYRIVERIGEGGMGEVYRAAQSEPLRREVALKVVKAGMDTRNVLRRFENERQTLARMSHPGVAKVFDAGATESGRPYFAMELVTGEPITEFCDQRRLDLSSRLELFAAVCEAVQHAHQRGVIHRDLKPSNILVEEHEGKARPKIIDFGIAKATTPDEEDRTAATRLGQVIGTPEYMSPEQASIDGGVDTRTDVYSLGVVLYELLTGQHPYDVDRLRRSTLAEVHGYLRDTSTPRPSNTPSTVDAETADAIARARRTDAATLRRALRGDLDWITAKALESERERPYESAAALSADIQHHLRHEPVLAGPPSRAYRARKFVRRHRIAVSAGGVVTVALVVGMVGALVGLTRARDAEARAVAEAERATREAETARQVSDFLVGMFDSSRPRNQSADELTARELVADGVRRIRSELQDQPLIRARLLHSLGAVERSLEHREAAAELHEEALELRQRHGADTRELIESLDELGEIYNQLERFDLAKTHLERGLRLLRSAPNPDPDQHARMLSRLATVHWNQSDLETAEELFEEGLALERQAFGPDDRRVGQTLIRLGGLLGEAGQLEEARASLEEAVRILGTDPEASRFHRAQALQNLANIDYYSGEFDEAVRHYRDALEVQLELLGRESLPVGSLLQNIAACEESLGNLGKARPLLHEALAIKEKVAGPDSSTVGNTLINLGNLEVELGELESARRYYERSLRVLEMSLGPEHFRLADALSGLGDVQLQQGRVDAALASYREALELREMNFGPTHQDVALSRSKLARALAAANRFAEAESLFDSALQVLESEAEPGHPYLVSARIGYAELLLRRGEPVRSRQVLEREQELLGERAGSDSPLLADLLELLADALEAEGRSTEARAADTRAAAIRSRLQQPPV